MTYEYKQNMPSIYGDPNAKKVLKMKSGSHGVTGLNVYYFQLKMSNVVHTLKQPFNLAAPVVYGNIWIETFKNKMPFEAPLRLACKV